MKSSADTYLSTMVRFVMALSQAFITVLSARSETFIKDIMLVGGSTFEINSKLSAYKKQKWTVIEYDLNKGAGGDFIYLLYKTTDNNADGEYITGFCIAVGENPADAIQDENTGITYHLASCDGGNHFKEIKGDLNSKAKGDYIYLYYTKEAVSEDFDGVTGISFDDERSDAVGKLGYNIGYDLNHGAGGNYIYMHLSTGKPDNTTGNGTKDDPYVINNKPGWDEFASKVNTGSDSFSGKYVKLGADISGVTTIVAYSSIPFSGVFDGNGKTLNVNIDKPSVRLIAPFGYIKNATVKNLNVTGYVSSQKDNNTGLVGIAEGTCTVSNCNVNVDISGSTDLGGIVGVNSGDSNDKVIIENCIYSGSMTMSQPDGVAGGLIAKRNNMTFAVTNCLIKATKGGNGHIHPIISGQATDNKVGTVTGTYYLNTIDIKDFPANYTITCATSIAVSDTYSENRWEVPVKAVDGKTYYLYVDNEGISMVPGGTLKYYKRSGGSYTRQNDNGPTAGSQEGTLIMIYADNNEVYMLDLIYGFATGSYLKGSLQNNTITLSLPQTVYDIENNPTLDVAWVDVSNGIGDSDPGTATFTFNGKDLTLNNSSSGRVLGLVNRYDYSWVGFGDYDSEFKEVEPSAAINEPVTLPEGIEPQYGWTIEGDYRTSLGTYTLQNYAEVAFDGDDVYIKGLAYYFPDSWIKGTVSNGIATFDAGQYVGENSRGCEYLVGYGNHQITDIEFRYDAQDNKFVLITPYLLENNARNTMGAWGYYHDNDLTLKGPVQPPAGIDPETNWEIKGEYEDYATTKDIRRAVSLLFNGNEVYLKGLSCSFPDSWIKGTRNGSTITFASGQFVGKNHYGCQYLVGFDNNDIVFSYDEVTRTYTLDTFYIAETGPLTEEDVSVWGYYHSLIIRKAGDVSVPQGLKTDKYLWTGTRTAGWDPDETGNIRIFINIGIDGNDIYVQGLCDELPDAWVKGSRQGNTVTFRKGQFFGTSDFINTYTYDHYLTGLDNSQYCDLVFTYNETAGTFTSGMSLLDTDSPKNDYAYYTYTDNVWTRYTDMATTPSNPSFLYVYLTRSNPPCVSIATPITDVNGNIMDPDNLSYRLFSDINGNIQTVEFNNQDYYYLPKTLSAIPYSYDDDYDFERIDDEVWVNMRQSNVKDYDRIGIRTEHSVNGKTYNSEIVWFDLHNLTLSDTGDNNDGLISAADGLTIDVTLDGRTLYKDGYWNTICLPFALSKEQIAESPLKGAVIKKLDSQTSGVDGTTLTLNFRDVTEIESGCPYIIMWDEGEDIKNPIFKDVEIDASVITVVNFNGGRFVGCFDTFTIDDNNIEKVIYLGDRNIIGYSKEPRTLRALRAHIEIKTGSSYYAPVRKILFNDGNTTLVIPVSQDVKDAGTDDVWYTIQGVRLSGKPTEEGIYINNGSKVIIK